MHSLLQIRFDAIKEALTKIKTADAASGMELKKAILHIVELEEFLKPRVYEVKRGGRA